MVLYAISYELGHNFDAVLLGGGPKPFEVLLIWGAGGEDTPVPVSPISSKNFSSPAGVTSTSILASSFPTYLNARTVTNDDKPISA